MHQGRTLKALVMSRLQRLSLQISSVFRGVPHYLCYGPTGDAVSRVGLSCRAKTEEICNDSFKKLAHPVEQHAGMRTESPQGAPAS